MFDIRDFNYYCRKLSKHYLIQLAQLVNANGVVSSGTANITFRSQEFNAEIRIIS